MQSQYKFIIYNVNMFSWTHKNWVTHAQISLNDRDEQN